VFSGIMSVVFVTTLMLGIFLAVAVAGESLASESRPEMVAGLEDVANGRVLVPEVATAALIGYATGLCILAGMTLAILLAAQFAGVPRPGALDETYSPSFPAMSPILVLASAVMLLLPLLYALALGAWRRIPVALILTVPAILFGAAGIAFDSTPFNIAVHVAMTLVITFVVWRQGVLAGLIAIYVVSVVPATYVLLATGQILAGILGLACFAAPAVFGVLAHRRLRTVSALPRATPVTA
jgi:hypothetical protein